MDSLKSIIKRSANRLGYEISRIPAVSVPSEYRPVRPLATYSPWNTDASFGAAFGSIRNFTLVDVYRCYELWKLVEQASKLPKGSIIEIGVWRGGTGALLAKQAQNCGITDTVFLCDTFSGVVKAGAKDPIYRNGEHSDTTREIVEQLLFGSMGLNNVEILEGIFPEQTGHRVRNLTFRLCHIDVDVYQSAKDIVDAIWEQIVPGGVVVYDDFGFDGCAGVTRYVEEQTMLKDRIVIHNLNGHAIVLKL